MRTFVAVALIIVVFVAVADLAVYRTFWTSTPESEVMPIGIFGGMSLRLELATTTSDQERGLGGRTNVPADYGMLFIFQKADRYGFWMKNMRVSIDIFWLDGQGRVVSFNDNVATSTYPNVFYPALPARYVLETAAGFARAHSIATGTQLLLQKSQIISD